MQSYRLGRRQKVIGLGVVNILLLLIVYAAGDQPSIAPLIVGPLFWLCLFIWPAGFDTNDLIKPRNYIIGLFFVTMVLAPPGLFFLPERLTYLLVRQPKFWDYANMTSLLWGLGFAAYLWGLVGFKRRSGIVTSATQVNELTSRAPLWMLWVGAVLILLGVAGMTVVAGSFMNALTMGGTRAGARELLVSGTYRYTIWMEAVPIGACLVWYYLVRNLRWEKKGGIFLVLVTYLPLVPFYAYSSGRARTLIPLFLLIAVYHKFCHPIRLRLLALGFFLLIPLLSVWDNYRRGWIREANFDRQMAGVVVQGDLARYDVSVMAIAGFHESGMKYMWGETLAAAVLHSLPRSIGKNPFVGGTQAMGRAIFLDPAREESSAFATPLLVESYLNFSVAGVIVLMFLLGRVVRWLDGLYDSGVILKMILALAIVLKLPFGVSIEIGLSRIIWGAGLVWLLAFIMRKIFPENRRHPQASLQRNFVG